MTLAASLISDHVDLHYVGMKYVIGIDFDNTLVSYDQLMYDLAVQRDLVPVGTPKTKRNVQEYIRRSASGEREWQELQAAAYGPKMAEATPIEGALPFVASCVKQGFDVYIVSHKTKYAKQDQTNTNLHEAALAWMAANRFFDDTGLGLLPDRVYFEPSRLEKIERIKSLGCSHFIDDLEEVFLEASFPTNIKQILYAPQRASTPPSCTMVASTWQEISDYFFNPAK